LFTGNSNLNRIKINKIAKKRISKKKEVNLIVLELVAVVVEELRELP
jgi:hypothetical protein